MQKSIQPGPRCRRAPRQTNGNATPNLSALTVKTFVQTLVLPPWTPPEIPTPYFDSSRKKPHRPLFTPSLPVTFSLPFPTMDPIYYLQNPSYLAPNPPPPSSDPISREPLDHKDRFPQWSQAETKELLSIRAQLDRSFIATKRNKPLWESAAAKMQQRGFSRTPEQCKSKWKNLVSRYKARETTEGDRSFAFKEEMRSIFEQREEGPQCSDKISKGKEVKKRRKGEGEVEEALREFGRRQMEMEMRWMEAAEAREAERRKKEEEWRLRMAALGEERMEMERRWMEREEGRRAREEAKEERRHAIITAIVSKILEKESF